jgi:antitoxin CptB
MDTGTRKKRIAYRATHRGTKESDALVGGFFLARLPSLTDGQLDDADRILDLQDPDLMDWIVKREPVPADARSPLLDELIAFGRAKG